MSYSVRVVDKKPPQIHGKWNPLIERVLAELRQNPSKVVAVEFKEEQDARRFYGTFSHRPNFKVKVFKAGKFVYIEKKEEEV